MVEKTKRMNSRRQLPSILSRRDESRPPAFCCPPSLCLIRASFKGTELSLWTMKRVTSPSSQMTPKAERLSATLASESQSWVMRGEENVSGRDIRWDLFSSSQAPYCVAPSFTTCTYSYILGYNSEGFRLSEIMAVRCYRIDVPFPKVRNRKVTCRFRGRQ